LLEKEKDIIDASENQRKKVSPENMKKIISELKKHF
jgi:hypothetical protein